jgi:DNA-binding transcriptional ArsR family regulator
VVAVVEPELSATFAALADPTRRAILDRLAGGEATVAELTRPFAISQQAVSKHLKVLEQAGLISRGRDRQARPCRLVPGQLDGAAGWIDQHRRLWAERYDRLDAHLADLRREDQDRDRGQDQDQGQEDHESEAMS